MTNLPKALQNGLVMWLDGNGKDLSGNGNNGALVNAPTKVRRLQNDGLSYNGSNQTVNIPNSTALQLVGNYTQSIWVYQNGAGTNRLIQKDNSDNYSGGWSMRLSSSVFNSEHSYGVNTTWNSGITIPTNIWTLVTQAYDGSNRILYVNGKRMANVATTTDVIGEAGNNVFLGCYGNTSPIGQYYTGGLVNPMLWSRALSAKEIEALYYATFIK